MIVSACSVYIDSAVTSLITERRWALQQTQLVLVCSPHPHGGPSATRPGKARRSNPYDSYITFELDWPTNFAAARNMAVNTHLTGALGTEVLPSYQTHAHGTPDTVGAAVGQCLTGCVRCGIRSRRSPVRHCRAGGWHRRRQRRRRRRANADGRGVATATQRHQVGSSCNTHARSPTLPPCPVHGRPHHVVASVAAEGWHGGALRGRFDWWARRHNTRPPDHRVAPCQHPRATCCL